MIPAPAPRTAANPESGIDPFTTPFQEDPPPRPIRISSRQESR